MSEIFIKGKLVENGKVESGYLGIQDGKIEEINISKPEGKIIDVGDFFVVPGFIDLHIHGVHTFLVDNGSQDLLQMCRILPQYGVTAFLPTLTPRARGEDAKFLSGLTKTQSSGAEILGFHLEGPFLKLTGALNTDAVSGAEMDRVNSLKEAAKPYKAIFSISPDVEGIEKLIPLMAENNMPVFMTHTAATVKETQKAIVLGACHATHFYDVFPCPPVTEPGVRPCGVVEAVLADEHVSVDFILDGVHVDPVAVKMALISKSKGPGCVCLITDANVGAGLEPGRFVFGHMGEIYFDYKGAPARSIKDNTLAGSGLTMDQALRNAVKWLDLALPEAIRLVSSNPAKVLRVDRKKGFLLPGYDADFVVLDENLNILQTWVGGKCFYKQQR